MGYVLELEEVDRTHVAVVGGKGAMLGELTRVEGVDVPAGFCVTVAAFGEMLAGVTSLHQLIDQLSDLRSDDAVAIRALSAKVRRAIEAQPLPEVAEAAVKSAVDRLGPDATWAVRSSGTTEDSSALSFAGQHDTYLNVTGVDAVLTAVRRCWASVFTERAIVYRARHDLEHRAITMAVVVQRMAHADAAGILFTADPLTSDRRVVSIETTLGPGDALVSGRTAADTYSVREDEIIARATTRQSQVLTDAQILKLARLGRLVEAHMGVPQDVEWCLVDGRFELVQSRPITTLFPIPKNDDARKHVYVSVGHQQMMTDAIRPLGLSIWQMTALRPMCVAGGRLFVDVIDMLSSPAQRESYLTALGRSDPLIGDALRAVVERGDIATDTEPEPAASTATGQPLRAPTPPGLASLTDAPPEPGPETVAALIGRSEASIAQLGQAIERASGTAALDVIRADLQDLRRTLFVPENLQVIMAAMDASAWLNDRMQDWLGETNAADAIAQSVPGNVTSEMGLALLDVADVIRPYPTVVAFLAETEDDDFLDELGSLPGGRESAEAIRRFLDRYGMRCVGEIDLTRPRWHEQPTALLAVLLSNIRNFEPGAAHSRFEGGRRRAAAKEQELLTRVRALPDGASKANETKRNIDRIRQLSGYREYPKYSIISRYDLYRRAILREADELVRAGVIAHRNDCFDLTFDELYESIATGSVDPELVHRRQREFLSYEALAPPRVFTADGEVITGRYRGEVPTNALIGLAVSAGVAEGRARVVHDLAAAVVKPGEILVTTFTDPSWTPLFVGIAGLITEVGGLMTHGAVIAREYGLPAVVGVERATELIRDGQLIRVHGRDGLVELLD